MRRWTRRSLQERRYPRQRMQLPPMSWRQGQLLARFQRQVRKRQARRTIPACAPECGRRAEGRLWRTRPEASPRHRAPALAGPRHLLLYRRNRRAGPCSSGRHPWRHRRAPEGLRPPRFRPAPPAPTEGRRPVHPRSRCARRPEWPRRSEFRAGRPGRRQRKPPVREPEEVALVRARRSRAGRCNWRAGARDRKCTGLRSERGTRFWQTAGRDRFLAVSHPPQCSYRAVCGLS